MNTCCFSLLVALLLVLSSPGSESQLHNRRSSCPTSILVNSEQKSYSTCVSLTDWAHLAWTYDPSNSTVDVLFRALLSSSAGWAGWGINFGPSPAMVGAKVLLGFRDTSGIIRMGQYNLTQGTKAGTQSTPSTTPVLNLVPGSSLVDITGNVLSIFAKVRLPASSSNKLNLVWSRGPGTTSNLSPLAHDTSTGFVKQTAGTIDLSSSSVSHSSSPVQQLKYVSLVNYHSKAHLPVSFSLQRHGALNVFGWGVFLPLGILAARYLRPFADPAWFYAHASLQSLGYILGTAGWGLGLKLATLSIAGAVNLVHRNLGIAIFLFATLQVLAFALRPNKGTKIRFYWNFYHRGVGYLTLILIIVNIYKGFSILQPPKAVQNLYSAFLVLAAIASISLEAYTWYRLWKKKEQYPAAAYSLDSPPTRT